MAITLNEYTMIDRYLSGEMNEAEKQQFKKNIKENSELEKEFELQQDLLYLMDIQEQVTQT